MDDPLTDAVVTPVRTTEDAADPALWSAPRMVVVTQFLAGFVFFVMALVNLVGGDPSGFERLVGVVAALVAGMAFGVAGSLHVQGRMVRRHLATCATTGSVPGVPQR